MNPTTTRPCDSLVRGVAEDGACLLVRLATPPSASLLREVWPRLGLRWLDVDPEALEAADAHDTVLPLDADTDAVALESVLSLFAAEHLRSLVAVHAALVVHRNRALIIPGPSHAGKTSLALATGRMGATVAGDEFVLVDPETGLVRAWPRPLHIRTPHGVRRVPTTPMTGWLRPTLVAALHYREGAGTDWATGPQGDAAWCLLENTVCGRHRPVDALAAAGAVARSAAFVSGPRGEADESAAAILTRLERQ